MRSTSDGKDLVVEYTKLKRDFYFRKQMAMIKNILQCTLTKKKGLSDKCRGFGSMSVSGQLYTFPLPLSPTQQQSTDNKLGLMLRQRRSRRVVA